MEKTQNKSSFWLILILSFLLSFSIWIPTSITTVKAETLEETPTSVEEIIENTTFITFRKGDETSKYGRNIFACYYIPNSVYESDYTYGVVLFPKDYGERLGLTSDYFKKAEEQNITIMDIMGTKNLETEDGHLFKCGIANILEQNTKRTFSFIFYAKDQAGNIAYSQPKFAAWATLVAEEYTDDEVVSMINDRITMESSFCSIVDKIAELVNSFWIYIVMAMGAVVVVWGACIGIRVSVANRREEQINSRAMVKGLVIGIIIMAVIAMACPLLINGLAHFVMWA